MDVRYRNMLSVVLYIVGSRSDLRRHIYNRITNMVVPSERFTFRSAIMQTELIPSKPKRKLAGFVLSSRLIGPLRSEVLPTESETESDLEYGPFIPWRQWIASERKRNMELITLTTAKRGRSASTVEIDLSDLSADTLAKLAKNPSQYARIDTSDYVGRVGPTLNVIRQHVESLGFKASFGLTAAQRNNVMIGTDGTVTTVLQSQVDEWRAIAEDESHKDHAKATEALARVIPAGTIFVKGRQV